MGLFNALFGKQQQRLVARMKNAANFAKLGIAEKMLGGMSQDQRPRDEKTRIVSASVNTVFSEPSPDPAFKRFADENATAISTEIAKLRDDHDARHLITQAVRVLVKVEFDEAHPEKALVPIQNLEKLGLLVPGGEEPVPHTFFDLVRSYCQKYMSPEQYQQIQSRI